MLELLCLTYILHVLQCDFFHGQINIEAIYCAGLILDLHEKFPMLLIYLQYYQQVVSKDQIQINIFY